MSSEPDTLWRHVSQAATLGRPPWCPFLLPHLLFLYSEPFTNPHSHTHNKTTVKQCAPISRASKLSAGMKETGQRFRCAFFFLLTSFSAASFPSSSSYPSPSASSVCLVCSVITCGTHKTLTETLLCSFWERDSESGGMSRVYTLLGCVWAEKKKPRELQRVLW